MGIFSFFKSKPQDHVAYARQLLAEGKFHEAKTEVLNIDGEEAHAIYAEAERHQKQLELAQAFVRPQAVPLNTLLNFMMRRSALVQAFKVLMEQEKPAPGADGAPPAAEDVAAALERVQQRFVREFHLLCATQLAAAGIAPNAYIEPPQVPAVEGAIVQAEQKFLEQLGVPPPAASPTP